MAPFHYKIPLLRRPFYQRDQALQQRDQAIAERDRAIAELQRSGEEANAPQRFSLKRLLQENPGLAQHYLWATNPMFDQKAPFWLHLGCGARVFDGFINLDISPQDTRVTRWNLLDFWPVELDEKVEGVFSEDCLEHFFHGEQTYILCNINCALAAGGVARIIMPQLLWPLDPTAEFRVGPSDLAFTYGVETLADSYNFSMRFTGHRWLHDQRSFEHMGSLCGFAVVPTNLSDSSVLTLNGLNLREGASSFANDLRKDRAISRILINPTSVQGATKVEDLASDVPVFLADTLRPSVVYELPRRLASEHVVCINFRSANLSSFAWGLKTLIIDDINRANPWYFDETLKSQPSLNIITKGQMRVALGGNREFSTLHLTPATSPGEYFTLGCAELYVVE